MKNATFGKYVSMTAACFMAATAAHAGTAIWQGGATGDINTTGNWNSGADITKDYLNFGQDVTATMSADTTVFDVFGNQKSNDPAFENRTVVFDMGGHSLWVTSADGAGKQYIKGNYGTTYLFTNGVVKCTNADTHSKTNAFYTSASNSSSDMSIIATGNDTTVVSSFVLGYAHRIGVRILNGAKAYGTVFGFGSSSEVRGGNAEVRFSNTCHVGPRESNFSLEADDPPHGICLLVDDATLAAENPSAKGTIYVGYGNCSYDNAIVATNGASIIAKTIAVGYGGESNGIVYSSSNNIFKATGTGTTVSLPTDGTGNGQITCGNLSSGNRFLAEKGAAVTTRDITVGAGNVGYLSSNNTFKATGAGTIVSAGTGSITCGKGVACGNVFLVKDGAAVAANKLYAGSGTATNNTFRADGAGTTVSARIIVGGDSDASANSFGNTCILANGITASAPYFWVNVFGSGNTMSILSGTTATVSSDIFLGGRSMKNYPSDCGANGRLEVVGEGTSLSIANSFVIRNSAGDSTKAQELFIGDGASVTHTSSNGLVFYGDGNRVVISNGTLTVVSLFVNGNTPSNAFTATNSTFRIEGASARLTASATKDVAGTASRLVGAPIFEFVIPEGGWASAPVAINQSFTIGNDTIIRIDAASARKFARAGGGTVPLISTGTSGKAITANVAELTASSDLPAGCSLQNKNGVISVGVKPLSGMVILIQ